MSTLTMAAIALPRTLTVAHVTQIRGGQEAERLGPGFGGSELRVYRVAVMQSEESICRAATYLGGVPTKVRSST